MKKKVSDLQSYIKDRKHKDPEFAKNFDSGYEKFKTEVVRQASDKTVETTKK